MYKVFIDNKVILFCEKYKIQKKSSNEVILSVDDWSKFDLIAFRQQTDAMIQLVVIAKHPEATILEMFKSYQLVEAAGGIVKRKNSYLFIERHGLWDIPKGKMDEGELPAETAVREIEEECGITGPVVRKPLGITFHTYEWKGKPVLKKNHWFVLDYEGPKTVTPQLEEAITKAVWLKKNAISTLKENTYASICEVIDLFLKK
ncbi:MAG: NUDIX domain-containing protein [Fluviicola sp.]|nr:NUDIX domain-containing protein [Fluviicola sp.]